LQAPVVTISAQNPPFVRSAKKSTHDTRYVSKNLRPGIEYFLQKCYHIA